MNRVDMGTIHHIHSQSDSPGIPLPYGIVLVVLLFLVGLIFQGGN